MDPLSLNQKKALLALARRAIERGLLFQPITWEETDDIALTRPGGAFVTLRCSEALRGCIGRVRSQQPLYATVQQIAVAAATEDFRFSPVRPEEVPQLKIEISRLTEPQILRDPGQIQVGLHGLIVSADSRSGLLLPQVAVEQDWDAEAFLSHTCLKAGLPIDYWRHGPIKIEVFTAEIFSEKED